MRLAWPVICGSIPKEGSIEVGHINFSPELQNTIGATETMYLMMQWAFENGYRRYEWKCNALNLKSRREQLSGLGFLMKVFSGRQQLLNLATEIQLGLVSLTKNGLNWIKRSKPGLPQIILMMLAINNSVYRC